MEQSVVQYVCDYLQDLGINPRSIVANSWVNFTIGAFYSCLLMSFLLVCVIRELNDVIILFHLFH